MSTPNNAAGKTIGRAIVDAVERLVSCGMEAETALEVVGDLVDAVESAQRPPEGQESASDEVGGQFPYHVLGVATAPFGSYWPHGSYWSTRRRYPADRKYPVES